MNSRIYFFIYRTRALLLYGQKRLGLTSFLHERTRDEINSKYSRNNKEKQNVNWRFRSNFGPRKSFNLIKLLKV